jgi:hypothetical protein
MRQRASTPNDRENACRRTEAATAFSCVKSNNDSACADGADDSFWTKIGAVFAHKDGKGYDVVLDCLPLDGRISIREPKEKGTPDAARTP